MGFATLPTQGTQQTQGIWSKNSPGVTPGVAQSPNFAPQKRTQPQFTLWQFNVAIENGHRNSGFSH